MNRKLFVLILSFSATSAVFSESVWWLNETYQPKGTTIESIPIKKIDPKWQAAHVLTQKDLSKEGQDYFKMIRENKKFEFIRGYDFTFDGDFNKDGLKDRAVVGVYMDESKATGRFLLVLTRQDKGWKKVFLKSAPGNPGFSVLNNSGGNLLWSFCFECDSGDILVWKVDHYEFENDEPGY